MNEKAEIGVIGMAVMGSNLARNLAHHGYRVAPVSYTHLTLPTNREV